MNAITVIQRGTFRPFPDVHGNAHHRTARHETTATMNEREAQRQLAGLGLWLPKVQAAVPIEAPQ